MPPPMGIPEVCTPRVLSIATPSSGYIIRGIPLCRCIPRAIPRDIACACPQGGKYVTLAPYFLLIRFPISLLFFLSRPPFAAFRGRIRDPGATQHPWITEASGLRNGFSLKFAEKASKTAKWTNNSTRIWNAFKFWNSGLRNGSPGSWQKKCKA